MPKAIHQTHYRNCELEWWPTDTKENFDQLMQRPDYREYAQSVGWDQPNAITYKFNNDGFRSNDFDPLGNNNLIALGCSFTMGIGLPVHQVWPWVVAKELDFEVCNLAMGGASADSCYRMAEYWIPKLRPKLVVMLTPPLGRLELIDKDDGTAQQIMPHDNIKDQYVKTWLTIDQNSQINKRKNESAVWAVCQRAKIPCLIYNSSTYFAQAREVVGYARDYMHAGAIGHSILSTQILKDFNNLST